MVEHKLTENDSLEKLSVFYHVPVCMIMRANGLTISCNLNSVRTLLIPDRQYCLRKYEERRMPPPQAKFIEYEIHEGDTIFEIAQQHRTTMNIIARLNNIADPSMLYAGQKLKIPRLPPGCIKYSVKPSELLQELSSRYNVPEKCLRSYNCLHEDESIYPGMQLIIPTL